MSRLRTPEVEVIRFNEADVIVASGGTLTMTNFGDSNSANNVTTYKSDKYIYNDGQVGLDGFINYIKGDVGYNGNIMFDPGDGNEQSLIGALTYKDDVDGADYNGTYRWYNGVFVRTNINQ